MEDTAEDTEEFSALEEAWELGEELLSGLLQPRHGCCQNKGQKQGGYLFFHHVQIVILSVKAENRISARCNICFAAHPANCPGRRILS